MSKTLRCDCAADAEFKPAVLLPGLFVQRCPECSALLIYLHEYHRWRRRYAPPPAQGEAEAASCITEVQKVHFCADCGFIMSRYRVGGSADFCLYHCSRCALVRLDDRQWSALQQMGLTDRLAEILSDSWQRRLRAEAVHVSRHKTLRKRLGEEKYAELLRVHSWLWQQPDCHALLSLLGDKDL